MKTVLPFSIFFVFTFGLAAQTDSIPTPTPRTLGQNINTVRVALRQAFLKNDPAETGLWLDSLNQLENEVMVGVNWDERWLLYYWADNFGALLAEASQFGANERTAQAWKNPPPADSLFEIIDATVYELRFDIFQKIQQAFLSGEEKAFTSLLLEYLLRLNTNEEDWAARLEAFVNNYPSSRFNYFLNSIKPSILVPANKAFGFSGHFLSGSWSKELERSLNQLYAAQFDIYYWVARWNVSATTILGGQKLARDVNEGYDIWPKNDPSNFFAFGLEIGYDVVNNSKVRIFPAFGGAFAKLLPATSSEDPDNPVPDYYSDFQYLEAHLSASVTADVKLFGKNTNDWGVPKGSYHGIRMRVGYNWLNYKGQNKLLDGNMFYFAIGYNLFAFKEAKQK